MVVVMEVEGIIRGQERGGEGEKQVPAHVPAWPDRRKEAGKSWSESWRQLCPPEAYGLIG